MLDFQAFRRLKKLPKMMKLFKQNFQIDKVGNQQMNAHLLMAKNAINAISSQLQSKSYAIFIRFIGRQ